MEEFIINFKNVSKIRLALLSGGLSEEREVSIRTGDQIYAALDKSKYEISRFDPKSDLKALADACLSGKIDIVFPALHGPYGEDGRLQGMLDLFGLPYVFSGCLASALSMDKYKTLLVAKDIGINIAKHKLLSRKAELPIGELTESFAYPVVVKPVDSGSSIGISIAGNADELAEGIGKAFLSSEHVLLEQFIHGRELTVAVMDDGAEARALPVIEIKPKVSAWFDYSAKYQKDGSDEICPALVPEDIRVEVQNAAKNIFLSIGCSELARADFIWNEEDGNIYFLEINTIPGMTETSLAPLAAKTSGYEFAQFLDALIDGALNRHKKNVSKK